MQDNGFDQLSLKKLCVLMDRHGKWLNADCAQAESFVCEMKVILLQKNPCFYYNLLET